MGYLNLDIVFKQTTSKRIKCKFCTSFVEGEKGYIKINLSYKNTNLWGSYQEKRIPLCHTCFKKWMDKIATATENKKESYNKLVKTKILKSLK